MRFKSMARPKEHGALVLNEDGTFQVKPSPELREELSRLEERAIRRSQVFGTGLGVALVAAGAVAIAAGWVVGRLFGSLGSTVSMPRKLRDVEVDRDEGGCVTLRMRSVECSLKTVALRWNADEVLGEEADAFVAKLQELKAQE
jgi:hypothetical protein